MEGKSSARSHDKEGSSMLLNDPSLGSGSENICDIVFAIISQHFAKYLALRVKGKQAYIEPVDRVDPIYTSLPLGINV